jgi:multicomponent Na+:H+ antiporter subunit F
MTPDEFLAFALDAGTAMLVLTVAVAFLRLCLGPSLHDRVVALDMMTVGIVSFCGLAAIRYGEPVFIDVALVLALVGFLATVALARYAERTQPGPEEAPK